MIATEFHAFAIHRSDQGDKLIVNYRVYDCGRMKKRGFWLFPLDVGADEVFERAYIETQADRVYMQWCVFLNEVEQLDFTWKP